MLVFLGSHPLQLEAKSLRLHSHCTHSAHENPSAHARRTSLPAFRKLAEIIHFSFHLAMKTPRTIHIQAKLESALTVKSALIKPSAGKSQVPQRRRSSGNTSIEREQHGEIGSHCWIGP